LINITINKVYVFHKNLKEIEDFFSLLLTRIDDNPVIQNLITQILTNDSIRYSHEQQYSRPVSKRTSLINESLLPNSPRDVKCSHDSVIQKEFNFYRDLGHLSQLISDILFLVLNDPYYHCNQIYKFFNSH
jgi:hypothetical protein